MPRMVMCRKLGKELPALPFKPFTDDTGRRLYEEVSMEAWQMWLKDSVKYVNTYRLDLTDKNAQAFMRKQMLIYFGFEEGNLAETAWTPAGDGGGHHGPGGGHHGHGSGHSTG